MTADPLDTETDAQVSLHGVARRIARDEVIYDVGRIGLPWRLVSGLVRLDRTDETGAQFASLAMKGDLLGSETLLYERYVFRATALTACRIEPWLPPHAANAQRSLLQIIPAMERRAADLLALRTGHPFERVRRLMLLIAASEPGTAVAKIASPRLRDMADMTNLAAETVSRAISELRRKGVLQRNGQRRADVAVQELSVVNFPQP